MEGSAYAQREGPFGSGGLGCLACCGDGLFFAGNDDLAFTVVVGGDHRAGSLHANAFHFFCRQGDNGGHRARYVFAALLHRPGADGDKPQGILKAHGPGGGQGGYLAERMACDHVRRKIRQAGCLDD